METNQPGVSLCLIVKDEEANLPRCLESAQGLVDEIILVDTGSADRTVEIARQYGALVFDLPWPGNFSAARNYALEKARREWVFWLDADEELASGSRAGFRQLLEAVPVEGYLAEITNLVDSPAGEREILRHASLRLWRNRPGYRFRGVLHEEMLNVLQEVSPRALVVPGRLSVIHHGYTAEAKAGKRKGERNRSILEQALAADPDNTLLQYYLGLEYWQAGEAGRAAEQLERVYRRVDRQWPHAATLFRNYAICLLGKGDFTQALALLERGVAWFPDYTDLFYLQAVAYRGLDRIEQALEALQHCLQLGEAPAGYVSTRGVGGYKACQLAGDILERAGAWEEAARAYTLALQRHPEYPPALYGLARVLARLGDAAWCVSYLDRYFDFASPRAVELAVDSLAAVGLAESAVTIARRAVSAWPADTRARRALARACLLREREVLAAGRQRWRAVPVLEKEARAVALALQRLDVESGEVNAGGRTEP